ncbi:M3 family metallopeptidase [Paraglaciecola sp. 25GB23A]|uniref:M3 family metallopeptidase n=1 Tax=Paraglaciecola sp. 25GB23A TaxID=3156068 RepID=UPI0032B0175C
MRRALLATAISAALALAACSPSPSTESVNQTKQAGDMQNNSANIFMSPSPLFDQAPQFDKIAMADYLPAFTEGMAQQQTEITRIANNPEPATFENTLVAMELSSVLLDRVSHVFFALSGVISNDEFQNIEAELAPKLSAHSDNIYLNPSLFARVETIYADKASLNAEDQRLVDYYHTKFLRAGAKLNDAEKTQMRVINEQISSLQTDFSQNLLASFKNDVIVVTDKNLLAGLSEAEITGLAEAAKNAGKQGYMITLVNTTRQPILSSLSNREMRQRIWQTSANRAMDNNGPVLLKLVKLRAEKASLLAYANWASYATADQMAKEPKAIFAILDELAPQALAKAKIEAAEIEEQMHADGVSGTVQAWDWAYYAEKVREAKYDLDDNLVKPYFELNSVLENGLFFAMEKFYGIHFKERKDLPVYHEDVRLFEVFNQDNSSIGLFYFDPYAREGKGGGAWMDAFVSQSFLLNEKPVVFNVLNIVKPANDQATLLSFDEATTLFHEFGHAAHGLFSQVKYPSLAGTSTARDFVEFPSQFNEDWDIEPTVIANYALNNQTGEAIPTALLERVLDSVKFGQGYDTVEYLAAALLDMEWHMIGADANISDVAGFEQQALQKHGLDYAPIPPRYKSAYFSHTFAGGYSAGYYAYLWTEVFAADAFAHIQNKGGMTRENGDDFRQKILSIGNSKDLMQSYVEFRGQQPSTNALLKRRGLIH